MKQSPWFTDEKNNHLSVNFKRSFISLNKLQKCGLISIPASDKAKLTLVFTADTSMEDGHLFWPILAIWLFAIKIKMTAEIINKEAEVKYLGNTNSKKRIRSYILSQKQKRLEWLQSLGLESVNPTPTPMEWGFYREKIPARQQLQSCHRQASTLNDDNKTWHCNSCIIQKCWCTH